MSLRTRLAGLLLSLREVGYRLLTPIDALTRSTPSREPLPPLWLRRHVGAASARHFRRVTEQGERQLDELLAGASPRNVLDLGCGCGSMAPYFQRLLPADGSYLGLDIHRGCIEWSRRRFAGDRRLAFELLPEAAERARGGRYDLILAKSLFTHLPPKPAGEYMTAAAQALTPDGRLVLTAFLFDGDRLVPALPCSDPSGLVRYRTRWRPEAAVGFERRAFLERIARSGLEVVEQRLAFWPGALPRLSAQDLLVCRRAPGSAA